MTDAMRLSVAELTEFFRVKPAPPYRAVPYDAVRGISWTIVDGEDRHIATVFEEEYARLITHRMNG